MRTDFADPALTSTDSAIDRGPLVNRFLVMAHFAAGIGFLMLGLLAGLLYSLQFIGLYPFSGVEYLAVGRVNFVYTNTLLYGFTMNMYLAAMYWAVPRITKRRVLSTAHGWLTLGVWNLGVVVAVLGLLGGYAQAVEWGETPNGVVALLAGDPHIFFADELLFLGLIFIAVQFFPPMFSLREPMYISCWYFTASIVWLLLLHIIGNYVPELLAGASGAVFTGMFRHGLVGLFIVSIGWGLMYYFIPAIIKRPIWSRPLALLGFWGLAFFYPLGGVSQYIYSPTPRFAQYIAIIAVVAIQVITITVFVNFFMTLRGRENYVRLNIAVRYFYTGMIFYVIVALQGALQTQFWAQEILQFTDWMVGHTHTLLYGVFGFWMLGMVTDLWPRVVGKPSWYSRGVNEWAFWLNTIGIVMMFISLTAGGLIEGFMWQELSTWESQINSLQGPWRFRSLSILIIIAANSLLIFNMVMTTLPAQIRAVKRAVPTTAVGD